MKLPSQLLLTATLSLYMLGIGSIAGLEAQTAEGKVIPTEVSEPPYKVGDLVVQQGYYIDQGNDQPRLNFRFENNQIRIYWIDADGLIAEAKATAGSVHFDKESVRGNPNYPLNPLPEKTGLASVRPVIPPHNFQVRLLIKSSEEAEATAYRFKYSLKMDQAIDPTSKSK